MRSVKCVFFLNYHARNCEYLLDYIFLLSLWKRANCVLFYLWSWFVYLLYMYDICIPKLIRKLIYDHLFLCMLFYYKKKNKMKYTKQKTNKYENLPKNLVWFFFLRIGCWHFMLLLLSIKCSCRRIEHSQRESNVNQAPVQSLGISKL